MKIHAALLVTALLTTSATAMTVKDNTLQGTLQDWETGKTGEVQLNISALSPNYLDILDSLATAAVSKDGRFTLKLPDAAKLKAALKPAAATYALGEPCKGTLNAKPAASLLFFEVGTYADGLRLATPRLASTNLQLMGAGDSMALLVYASAATRLTGTATCGFAPRYTAYDGPYNAVWDAQLSPGWNLLPVSVLPTKDKVLQMSVGGGALPAGLTWTQYLGSSGIGAGVSPSMSGFVSGESNKGMVIVFSTIQPGGPAEKAGLKTGDVVVSVDGKSVAGLEQLDVARMVRGKPGTPVTIVVQRGTQTLTFTITRAFVRI